MKSDVIHVTSDGAGIAEALRQTEAVAAFKALNKKDSIHLVLLAEEMMGMMQALTGEHEADFWIEDEDNTFRLHLLAETKMNTEMRNNLLSASTSGENIAAKGVMGKVKDLFNRILEPTEGDMPEVYSAGWVNSASTMGAAAYAKNTANIWSLNKYKASAQKEAKENWDELEKSIVANIADEIEIGISDDTVEMIVFKKV